MELLAQSGSRFVVGTPDRCVVVDLVSGRVWPVTTLDTVLRFAVYGDVQHPVARSVEERLLTLAGTALNRPTRT